MVVNVNHLMVVFLFHFEAVSLLSEVHTENTLGFKDLEDLSSIEVVVIDGRPKTVERDFKVKILTWKDSEKGFVKQVSSGGFSN